MNKSLRRGTGTAIAAGIAILSTGTIVPATAVSYAVQVTTTASTAVVTADGADARFDLSIDVRAETGPMTVKILPRIVTDTEVPQVVVDATCTSATLPGAGIYEVTCEGPARWGNGFTEGVYDLTGQLVVESVATGQFYALTTLLHRLDVEGPVEPTPDVHATAKCQHAAQAYVRTPKRPMLANRHARWGHKPGTPGATCGEDFNRPGSRFGRMSSEGYVSKALRRAGAEGRWVRKGSGRVYLAPRTGTYVAKVHTSYVVCSFANGVIESCGTPKIAWRSKVRFTVTATQHTGDEPDADKGRREGFR